MSTRPAFAGDPVATALFVFTVGVWVALEVRQSLNRRDEATKMDRGSAMVLWFCVATAAVLAAVALSVAAADLPYGPLTYGIGLALIWAGVGLRLWSFRALGRYFTFTVMTSQDQRVIEAGPYRALRHPSYAGMLLILAGIGVAYGNWLSVAALVFVPLGGFVNRIRVEEAALASSLGPAYERYARGRRRLIPFVW